MKFLSLNIHNFLALGEASIKLADRGLVLLQGINEDDTSADSNGAGKSSVVDALCWCLYGTTARGEEGDKVVNRTAGKDCSVSITVQDGSDVYDITRYRKHKTGKNSLVVKHDAGGAGVVDLTKGTDKLTQALVNEIIGSSYDVFRASIYAGQESFPDLPSMTDKQLKVLVEEASGVTILEKAYEDARARHAEVKARGDKVQLESDRTTRRILDLDDTIDAAKGRKDDFTKSQARLADDLASSARAAVAEAKRLKAELDTHDEAGARSGLAACDAAIAAVGSEITEERRLVMEMTEASGREVTARSHLNNAKLLLEGQVRAVKEVDKSLGCLCETCARPLTAAELAPTKASKLAGAQKMRAVFDAARSTTEGAIAAHKSVADRLSTFRASMTDVSANAAQRASHDAVIRTIEKLKAEVQRKVDEAKRLGENRKDALTRSNPYDAEITKLTADRAAQQLAETELVERMDEIAKELEIAEIGVSVFSPAGVRAEILDTVTPFLNAQTAKYLSILSDDNIEAVWTTLVRNAKGELREKFAIEVTSKTGGERFTSVSGGEKRKVRIAAALALQDLVSNRATKPIDLFLGDEIDDALDSAGLERLMVILEEKARERGSVFVVSHADLKSWIPNVITVTKKGGFATIAEEVA